jgi:hypothetical protein
MKFANLNAVRFLFSVPVSLHSPYREVHVSYAYFTKTNPEHDSNGAGVLSDFKKYNAINTE